MKKLFLAFVAIAIVSSSVQAKYSGGSGTAGDPYRIGSATDLLTLAGSTGDYDANFILTADIDLAYYTFTAAVIAPDINIYVDGFQGTAFTGVFDGNGHKITNLTISGSGYLGLFGTIEGPGSYWGYKDMVKNLTIENVNITGSDPTASYNLGGLAGYNLYGAIKNCYSSGTITRANSDSGADSFGGLIGYNDYGKINSCSSSVNIYGGRFAIDLGGLAGYNYYGNINNSFATGDVSGEALSLHEICEAFGGLVGRNEFGTINECWASGNVTSYGNLTEGAGGDEFGGLVGLNTWSTISNCYAIGSVTSNLMATGGLVGANDSYSTITNCYSTGSVLCTNTFYGGLVGDNLGTVTASFWDINTSGLMFSDGGEGNTTAEMKTRSTFTNAGWDFVGETANGTEDIWRMCVNDVNYPLLWWQFNKADFTCPDGVDFIDFAKLAEWWNHTDCADNNDCDRTDMDLSGAVDIYDLKLFCNSWLE